MPYILIGSRGGGEYCDGYNRLKLRWTVENDVLHVVSEPNGEFSDLTLQKDADGSMLKDLQGRPILIGGDRVRKLASIAGDWEGEGGNSLHIRENGYALWRVDGYGNSDVRISPENEGFDLSMKFLDRQLHSRLRLDETNRTLVWSSDNGKTNRLRRATK